MTHEHEWDSQSNGSGEPLVEEPLPDAPLRAILEALLFASEDPLTVEEAASVLGEDRRTEIANALGDLRVHMEKTGGGLRVQAVAGGYRITTDPALGPFVRALVRSRNRQRLSRAALETLAIIAYKQPITAPEIQEIRGVNPSAILASLLDRRLVRILGRKKVVGKPFVYGTTRDFLIRFGLNALEDLPSMEEFEAMLQASGEGTPPQEQETPDTGTEPGPSEP
ncbi:MAG: SMC-Scp complex subunit ScpB [Candidatus Polarisedimenticolia bacterium]